MGCKLYSLLLSPVTVGVHAISIRDSIRNLCQLTLYVPVLSPRVQDCGSPQNFGPLWPSSLGIPVAHLLSR